MGSSSALNYGPLHCVSVSVIFVTCVSGKTAQSVLEKVSMLPACYNNRLYVQHMRVGRDFHFSFTVSHSDFSFSQFGSEMRSRVISGARWLQLTFSSELFFHCPTFR